MISISKIRKFYNRPPPALLVMPKFGLDTATLGLSQRMRRGLALAFICAIFSAMIVYVWAVNAMLFGGEAIQKGNAVFTVLEREHSALESVIAERRSPSWLEETARIHGMVDVIDVRYLKPAQSVALLRQ